MESKNNLPRQQPNPKSFWIKYYKVRLGGELEKIFNKAEKPVTIDKELKIILRSLCQDWGLNIDEIQEYFTQRVNPSDHQDSVDLYDLSLDAIRRRLGNFILEKIFEIEEDKDTEISNYLHNIWDKENPEEFLRLKIQENIKQQSNVKSQKSSQRKLAKASKSPEQSLRSYRKEAQSESPEQSIRSIDRERLSPQQSPKLSSKKKELTNEDVKQLKEQIESAVSSVKNIDSEFATFISQKDKESDRSGDASIKTVLEKNEEDIYKLISPKYGKGKKGADSPISSAKYLESQESGEANNGDSPNSRNEGNFSFIDKSSPKPSKSPRHKNHQPNPKNDGSSRQSPKLLDPKNKSQRDIYNDQTNALKDAWLTKILEPLTLEIEKVFYSYDPYDEKVVEIKQLKNVFIEVMKMVNLELSEFGFDDFEKILEKEFPSNKISKSFKIDFKKFMEIMQKWSMLSEPEPTDFPGKIKRMIKQYENIIYTYGGLNEDTSSIEALIQELKNELQAHTSAKEIKLAKQIADQQRKNLSEIFQFYSKIQNMMGQDPTFDEINESYSVWTVVKFLKFLTDFNVLGKQEERARYLNKGHAIAIFKKLANNSRLMSENQFIESLDKLSELYYNKEYDTIYNTSVNNKTLLEKRDLFYRFLELDNRNALVKKAKGFRIAFSHEKGGARISENDTSKRYIFRMSPVKKQKLEEWRKMKQSKSAPHSNFKARPPQSQKTLNETKIAIPPSGYAQRRRVQRIVRGEEIPYKLEEPVVQQLKSQKVLTLQEINGMDYGEIDEQEDLKDLITDENDEYLDQLWGFNKKEPQSNIRDDFKKLQNIIKMHDEKIARGLKVLEKARQGYGYGVR